nr:cupin domain-containing protein [Deinobacterium chartae]
MAKLEGEFAWHRHDAEDERVFVLRGTLRLRFRPQDDVLLGPGELAVVPAGAQHLPVAEGVVRLLLVKPSTTLNTGNVRGARLTARPRPAAGRPPRRGSPAARGPRSRPGRP